MTDSYRNMVFCKVPPNRQTDKTTKTFLIQKVGTGEQLPITGSSFSMTV